MGYMVAVVGKGTAGFEYGAFSHDLIPLDHGGGTILIDENPLSAQQGNGGLSQVANGHEIYEGMQVSSLNGRLFLVMDEFVELGLQTVQFFAVFLHR